MPDSKEKSAEQQVNDIIEEMLNRIEDENNLSIKGIRIAQLNDMLQATILLVDRNIV